MNQSQVWVTETIPLHRWKSGRHKHCWIKDSSETVPWKQTAGRSERWRAAYTWRRIWSRGSNKRAQFCLGWKQPNSEIRSPHSMKPDPGPSGPYLLPLDTAQRGAKRRQRLGLQPEPTEWQDQGFTRLESTCSPASRLRNRAVSGYVLCPHRQKTLSEVCCFTPMSYHLLRAPHWRWCWTEEANLVPRGTDWGLPSGWVNSPKTMCLCQKRLPSHWQPAFKEVYWAC